jgi:hypothetical protein
MAALTLGLSRDEILKPMIIVFAALTCLVAVLGIPMAAGGLAQILVALPKEARSSPIHRQG